MQSPECLQRVPTGFYVPRQDKFEGYSQYPRPREDSDYKNDMRVAKTAGMIKHKRMQDFLKYQRENDIKHERNPSN